MKPLRNVLGFELLEQKRLLAADLSEHEPAVAALTADAEPLTIDAAGTAIGSVDGTAVLLGMTTTDEVQALNEVEAAENDDSDGADEQNDDENDDDGTDDDADDDENGENETVLKSVLMPISTTDTTSMGKAKFESGLENGATEREVTVKVKGRTPDEQLTVTIGGTGGTGGTSVGTITVGADGKGKLKLSSDPDEGETELADSVTINAGTEIRVGNVLKGTFATTSQTATANSQTASALSVQSSSVSVEPVFAVISDFGSVRRAPKVASEPVAGKIETQVSPDTMSMADLLLSIMGVDADDKPKSTEFVGRSRSDELEIELAALDIAYQDAPVD